MQQLLQKAQDAIWQYGPGVLMAAATLFFGWIISRFITGLVRRGMGRAKVDPTLTGFAAHMLYFALMTLVIITALGKLGVPTASFVAVIGAAGLAVGFALQGSLANFAAGVMLIVFRPFKVGDYVEGGGVAGTVEEIQIFATRFKTPDNKLIIVPNSSITGGQITNYSANPMRRVDLVFGIGYGDDIRKAKSVLEQLLAKDERVLKEPAPTIGVLELGDSSVNLACRPWVNTSNYWGFYFDFHQAVKEGFDAQGISIPFPQRDVHMHQAA